MSIAVAAVNRVFAGPGGALAQSLWSSRRLREMGDAVWLPKGLKIMMSPEFVKTIQPGSADKILCDARNAQLRSSTCGAAPAPAPAPGASPGTAPSEPLVPSSDELRELMAKGVLAAAAGAAKLSPAELEHIKSRLLEYKAWIQSYLAANPSADSRSNPSTTSNWRSVLEWISAQLGNAATDLPSSTPPDPTSGLNDLVAYVQWIVSSNGGLSSLVKQYRPAIKQMIMDSLLETSKSKAAGSMLTYNYDGPADKTAVHGTCTAHGSDDGKTYCANAECTVCPASWWQDCPVDPSGAPWKMMASESCGFAHMGCRGICSKAEINDSVAVAGICEGFLRLEGFAEQHGATIHRVVSKILATIMANAGMIPNYGVVIAASAAIFEKALPALEEDAAIILNEVADICGYFSCAGDSIQTKDGVACVCAAGAPSDTVCNSPGSLSSPTVGCAPPADVSADDVVRRTCYPEALQKSNQCFTQASGRCMARGGGTATQAALQADGEPVGGAMPSARGLPWPGRGAML